MSLRTNSRIVQSVRIPLLVRRDGCGIIKSREATEAPQTGWSLTRKCFKTHSETSLASDHPVRAFSERDHFLMARPPLLGKEGNMPTKRGWYQSFCYRPLEIDPERPLFENS